MILSPRFTRVWKVHARGPPGVKGRELGEGRESIRANVREPARLRAPSASAHRGHGASIPRVPERKEKVATPELRRGLTSLCGFIVAA